ncbi:serine/threonine-protein kinase [Streptomyces sp. NRRL S-813]|uniref:serine/threonine-protein kinase n=1 Tax=Streptomyces sp. NRRL S-813 TaxID=1463919 RepID=UPI0004BEE5D9|nr:serine/threonine-protein kinase [Streptomyces sp. NRRL S-813]
MHHIGGYAVERRLGEGGMGTVFLARTRGGRAVALKVAKPELAVDPVFRERFRAEVAAARTVGGFHTAPVVDADVDGNPPWLATAYIPGPTLAEQLAANGPMSEPHLRALAAALAEALASIHACGLVHRDLKPGNIIMAADGPRVLDFGIARALESSRLTATGTAFGTPGYLSPEQALGQDVTGASDVFALGAVLVAAAGGSAWGEGTSMALMYRSVHEPPDLSEVPAGLHEAVAACLHKDPSARPTPGALLDLVTGPAHSTPAAYTPTLAVPPPAFPPPASAPTQPATPPRFPPAAMAPPPEHQQPLVIGDRSASITADTTGVTLQVDTIEADFDWPEISAVICTPGRRGRFTVTVRLHDGMSYPCELDARRADQRDAWIGRLRDLVGRHLGR